MDVMEKACGLSEDTAMSCQSWEAERGRGQGKGTSFC